MLEFFTATLLDSSCTKYVLIFLLSVSLLLIAGNEAHKLATQKQ